VGNASMWRLHPLIEEWGASVRQLATVLEMLGQSMEDRDEISGPLCAGAVLEHMARLPEHIRHAFIDGLSDEAARGAKSDDLYMHYVDRAVSGAPGLK